MQMSEHDSYDAPEVGQQSDRTRCHNITSFTGQRPDPSHNFSNLESRQPDFALFDSYKESVTSSPQPAIFGVSPETPSNPGSDNGAAFASKDRGPRKRQFWVLIALGIVIIVAAAAIGGGVGGTRHRSAGSASSSNQPPLPTLSNMTSSSSSSSIVLGVSIPTMSTGPSVPTSTAKPNSKMLNITNLASVVWNFDGVNEYRVWCE